MSEVVEDVVEIVTFGLWWPDGDPDDLRRRAEAWRAMADALDVAHGEVLRAALDVLAANDGDAVDAYGDHNRRVLELVWDVADACRQLARDLDDFADELHRARRRIAEMAQEIAATIALGVGFAILTAGLSAGASGAITAAMVGRAALLARFVGQRAVEITARIVATAIVGAAEGAAADLVVQTVPQLTFTDNANPFDQVDLDLHQVGVSTALGGVVGGAFGGVQALRHPALPVVRVVGPRTGEEVGVRLEALTPGRNARVKIVPADADVHTLYRELAAEGVPANHNYGGLQVRLDDGTWIGIREHSGSGGATIDVRYPGDARPWKVHSLER